jgi:hypothetical protein
MNDLLTAVYGFGWVPPVLWVLLAWVVMAVVVGLVVGRIVRRRDMQVPPLPPSSPEQVEDGEQAWTTTNS